MCEKDQDLHWVDYLFRDPFAPPKGYYGPPPGYCDGDCCDLHCGRAHPDETHLHSSQLTYNLYYPSVGIYHPGSTVEHDHETVYIEPSSSSPDTGGDGYFEMEEEVGKRFYPMVPVPESNIMDPSSSGLPREIPSNVLEKVTDGFSEECKLGSGAFGQVYKGTFRNGNVIAVKRLYSQIHIDNDDQFHKEVTYLLNLKHQNIVQLIGFCAESKCVSTKLEGKYIIAEVQQRMLCFEYLNNGSLREHISDESCGLKWHIRYDVIRGICCGLHYLHTECNMVHLDLKPTNILLDHSMVPKVADFGISRLFGDQQSRTITATIKGTFGYMAPENLNNGLISYKADIFSLGVIIIEVMTGCRGYPYSSGSEDCSEPFTENVIANWRKRFERKKRHISSEKYIEQVKTCITIGLMCVNPEANKRPSVGDINRMLNILPQT